MADTADFRMIRPVAVAPFGGTFSSSGGTYYDQGGVLRTAAPGELRFTYDPADLRAPPRVLVEPAATNLLTYSEGTAAQLGSAGAVSDAAASLAGFANAIQFGDNSTTRWAYKAFATAAGGVYTLSLFVQMDDGGIPSVGMSTSSGDFQLVVESFAWGASSPAVHDLGGGKYRLALAIAATGAGTNFGLVKYPTQSARPFRVTGYQLEAGDADTSYVPTAGAPVTRAADTFTGTGLVYCNVPIPEPVYGAGTTYASGAVVRDAATGETYESITGGNLGHALTDTANWLDLGVTNRLVMLDRVVNSQTSNPDRIALVIVPGQFVSTITLLNVSGAQAVVEQPGTGYRKTISLVRHDVLSWYDFYFEEPVWQGDAFFEDIPPYSNGPIVVLIEAQGSTAALGMIDAGKSRTLGETQSELSVGVLSYSTTKTDTQGNVRMVRRPNARRMTCEVDIPVGFESEAFRLLSEYTDVEMVFIASTEYTMTYTFGFLGQWDVPLSITGKMASIEVRGLI